MLGIIAVLSIITTQSLALSQGETHLHWHYMCSLIGMGLSQGSMGDYEQGLANVQRAWQMAETVGLSRFRSMALDALGQHFQDLNLLSKAEFAAYPGHQRHAQGRIDFLAAPFTGQPRH